MQRKTLSRQVIALALPMAATRFIQMFTGFVNTMMVSHLGRDILAACALISAGLSFSLLIFISMLFSVGFIVGRYHGAKQYAEIGAVVQQGMLLSLLFALVMSGCFLLVVPVLRFFHQSPTILLHVQQYFSVLVWGAVPMLAQCCLEQFFYAVLKQRIVIIVNLMGMCVSIMIAYVFIFGKFGFPGIGISALAWAFVMQAWFNFFALLAICFFLKSLWSYKLFGAHVWRGLSELRQIFFLGWPMGLQFGGELAAYFVMTVMIGYLGVNALAAVQVTQQWMYLTLVPILAISEASAILVSRVLGANTRPLLQEVARSCLGLSLGLLVLLDLAFLFFPHFFASFYLHGDTAHNADILQLMRPLFALMALALLLTAARDVFSGLLRGLRDTRFPMYVGLLTIWGLVLPLGYYFAFQLHWGLIGFRLGGSLVLLLPVGIMYWRWRRLSAAIH